MKLTKDNSEIREELLRLQETLKEKNKMLQQQKEELDKLDGQLRLEEQELYNRHQTAAAESQAEQQIRQLQAEEKKAKARYKKTKIAMYVPVFLLFAALVILFGVLTVLNKTEQDAYAEKLTNLESDYLAGPEYIKQQNDFQLVWEQREDFYLQKKETLQDEISGYNALLLSNAKEKQGGVAQNMISLHAGNEEEIREYLMDMPLLSTKTLETTYFRDMPYYVCREKYSLPYYGNASVGTNVIYPGAMIKGDTLFSGNYAVAPVVRGSMDFVANIAGSPIVTVDEVSYGNVIKELEVYQKLAGNGERYKTTEYNSEIMNSAEEVNASLGISVQAQAGPVEGEVGGSIGKNYEEEKTNLLVTIRQIAYTVSAQPPQDCLGYFAEGADLSQLGVYAPAYISTVDYGRSIVIMISSNASEEELKAAVDATVDYTIEKITGQGVTAEIDAKYDKILKKSNTTCKITVIGGNAEAAEFPKMTVSNCMEKLSELLEEGEANGIVNPAPVSYTLNYVQSNSPVPCMQITKEAMFSKDEVNIVKLQWKQGVKKKGTVSCEINGIGANTIVLRPNILSIKDGEAEEGKNAIYVLSKEEYPNITINEEVTKNGWMGTEIKSNSKTVELFDEKTLKKYDISAVIVDRLDDME